jgi:hypothetical protein
MPKAKSPRAIPFDFIVERLEKLRPVVRPMFGCSAVYSGEKILAALRKKEPGDPDNGMWIATNHEHHASLKKDLPSMRTIQIFGVRESGWQNIPEDADSFEEDVLKACDLILKGDQRIGKIPKTKKKRVSKER